MFPFMRLVPRNFHRGNRAEIQTARSAAIPEAVREIGVPRDRAPPATARSASHLACGACTTLAYGPEEFTVRQRMREGIAQHNRRAQINAAFNSALARPVAVSRRHVRRAGNFQSCSMPRQCIRPSRVRKAGEPAAFSSRAGSGTIGTEFPGQRVGNLRPYFGPQSPRH